jgi:hypothetical protein
MSEQPKIPFCRADWLQDVSIELGRRFAVRHPFRGFSAEVDTCEHEGEELEQLTVWASTWGETVVCLSLWDDHTLRVRMILLECGNNEEFELAFWPESAGLSPERIAEAFRDSVAVSTRLGYGEIPEAVLRRIWSHAGAFETKGALGRLRGS